MNRLDRAKCRYAQDLRALRKIRGVSIETIHNQTRIIESVLRGYEANCLSDNSSFHRIYLRSLTRAYAQVVGLEVNQILEALDMALDGSYDGRLDPNFDPEGKPVGESVNESESEPDSESASESASNSEPKSGASSSKRDSSTVGG